MTIVSDSVKSVLNPEDRLAHQLEAVLNNILLFNFSFTVHVAVHLMELSQTRAEHSV